ncbi:MULTISPECIES: hypothetical protein [unclassified Paenibacillus]|uniref:hypothetical protein n=1 Tax=unclassified Paenibacillus TaxID=185978 RepID=UPI000429D8DD|nr:MULTISPECIES: hypothetical protein [unclassified Paenibacillus]KGP83528.1 hypothetical protein P364_0108200 [Paenibacillus sp. MAEPY2]KGP87709.1 hypothetical protein P363_0108390 [Paenibacillus sp. MAEPY1]
MKIGLNPKVIVSIVYVLAMFMVAMDGTVLDKVRRIISEKPGIQSVDQDIHSDQEYTEAVH